MLLRLLALCVWLVSIPGAALALTTIDFDTLPGGGIPTLNATVGDAYAEYGVHFGDSLDFGDRGTARWRPGNGPAGNLVIWDPAAAAGSTVGFHLLARFDQDVSFVSSRAVGGGAWVRMTAYDVNGLQLAFQQLDVPSLLVIDDVDGIRSVSWFATQPFNAPPFVDDLSFEMAVVPEPASLALTGLGLLVLGVAARRAGR